MIDVYQRHIHKSGSDRHYLTVSKIATAFWGIYAMGFAQFGKNFGALIEAVNMVGSLFYGGLLGVFVLASGFKQVGANGAFYGVLIREAPSSPLDQAPLVQLDRRSRRRYRRIGDPRLNMRSGSHPNVLVPGSQSIVLGVIVASVSILHD